MASPDRQSTDRRGPDHAAAPTPRAEVALDQTFDAESLVALRSAVAAHGADLGLTEHRVGDLVLVAHELASNAVRHGGATSASPGRLRLWREGASVVCEVSDTGPGLADPDRVGMRPVPPAESNGRGLWIIRRVVDRLHIDTGPDRTTLTTTLSLDGGSPG